MTYRYDDVGPYLDHPQDPRGDDDREWDQLSLGERRAQLDDLTRPELVEMILEQYEYIEKLERQCRIGKT